MSDPYPYTQAPTPSRHPTAPAALRRPHVVQPPSLLITSLDNARNTNIAAGGGGGGGVIQTPASSTSLSTPFSAQPPSAHPQTAGPVMRGPLTQSFRSQTGFSGTYNPQQWGPMSSTSPQSSANTHRQYRTPTYGPQPVGPDEPVASPPPPYSPRREPGSENSPRHATNFTSPSSATSPDTDSSHHVTPISAAAAISPDLQTRTRGIQSQRQTSTSPSPSFSPTPVFPPPPPLTSAPKARSRANSKINANGILSTLRVKTSSSNVHPDAINVLQEDTTNAIARAAQDAGVNQALYPPSARRAASTGGIGIGPSSSRTPVYTESPTTWEDNGTLPPPPPGPPPSAARAQSLNRYAESPSSGNAPSLPMRLRRPPGTGTALETVPPTPANWQDDTSSSSHEHSRPRGPSPLRIDTGNIAQHRQPTSDEPMTVTGVTPSHSRRDSSVGGLSRTPAVRNRSAKGIRERRSESRNGKGKAFENSPVDGSGVVTPWNEEGSAPKPANLVLGREQSTSKSKSSKLSPRSGRILQNLDEAIRSPDSQPFSAESGSFKSPYGSSKVTSARSSKEASNIIGPSSLEVPEHRDAPIRPAPISSLSTGTSLGPSKGQGLHLPPGPENRPISHLLHIPVSDDCAQVALTPSSKAAVERPVSDLLGPESPTAFAARANERHRSFAAREAAASNDSERLDIFVQYLLEESKIRREQYATIFEEGGVQVEDLVRGLFRTSDSTATSEEPKSIRSLERGSKRTSASSSTMEESSSIDEDSSASRMHESPSSATTNGSTNRPGSGWIKDYVPCLSPIASMSIVTGQDELESRGRAPSRWWEGSNSGDTGPSDGFKVLARSKRESKYMGVSKDARDSPAFYENRMPTPTNLLQSRPNQRDSQYSYGADEYPPEKVGWHEEPHASIPPPPPQPPTPASTPYTPSHCHLDVSRLVTLPPPYPRHHPAVNNSHPDLAEVRAVVRSLQEKSEPDAVRESCHSKLETKRSRANSWKGHQRSLHQQDIEFRISHGDLSSAEYEEAEAALQQKIFDSEKDVVQAEFDMFQDLVVSPLHALFTDRVTRATEQMELLSSRVFSDAQSHSPNLPQEEGDERPELLETLTMLKWLFDARESCHRQLNDLLTERNDRYKSVVTLPYVQQNLPSKVQDATSFFAQDAADRKKTFDRGVCDRARTFLQVIESNVSRGVEMQLDAFWSIAPQLKDLLHKVPNREVPGNFGIQIPTDEYEENPSYHDYPLQYLYSLLSHTEKSSYQFIESQVNLFCLLHEIRNAALLARLRAERSEKEADDGRNGALGDQQRWENWQRAEQAREEAHMTTDLKEKVGVVEGQWTEALGEELMVVRERVRGWLLEEGGWDDDLAADV